MNDPIELKSPELLSWGVEQALEVANRPLGNVRMNNIQMMRGQFLVAMPDVDDENINRVMGKILGRVTAFMQDDRLVAFPQFKLLAPSDIGDEEGDSPEGDDSSADLMCVDIEADYEVSYFVQEQGMSLADLEAFAKINSVMVAWSYWREFVGSSCARLNAKIPVMNLLSSKGAARYAGFGAKTKPADRDAQG